MNGMKDIDSLLKEAEKGKQSSKSESITDDADLAMERYKTFLRKEFKSAKSKQSQRQPV